MPLNSSWSKGTLSYPQNSLLEFWFLQHFNILLYRYPILTLPHRNQLVWPKVEFSFTIFQFVKWEVAFASQMARFSSKGKCTPSTTSANFVTPVADGIHKREEARKPDTSCFGCSQDLSGWVKPEATWGHKGQNYPKYIFSCENGRNLSDCLVQGVS